MPEVHDLHIPALLAQARVRPTMTILEVGALPLGAEAEPCHKLLRALPGSRILSFEPDEALCDRLNQSGTPGITYYPVALGGENGTRAFYETAHPMCSSLYQPDPRWSAAFNNLEVMLEKSVTHLNTERVDDFARNHGVDRVEVIKIDVQGAELEIFRGAERTLAGVLCIVTEVEFVPLYKGQPLFGDVSSFLAGYGFMFHKFLGLAGRAMKPIVVNQNANFPIQHMWADAVFVRDLLEPERIADDDLLKIAVFAELYDSVDVANYCLRHYDQRRGTGLAVSYVRRLTGVA